MGLFGLGASLDRLAEELASEFSRICPVGGERQAKPFKRQARIDKGMDRIYDQARDYRQAHGLGILARARLAKSFQREMTRLGYEQALVNKVTTALVMTALVKTRPS